MKHLNFAIEFLRQLKTKICLFLILFRSAAHFVLFYLVGFNDAKFEAAMKCIPANNCFYFFAVCDAGCLLPYEAPAGTLLSHCFCSAAAAVGNLQRAQSILLIIKKSVRTSCSIA